MNEYNTRSEIEKRLDELDRMESQIQFSATYLTADDYVKLNRIRDEQRELKSRMEELVNNLSK